MGLIFFKSYPIAYCDKCKKVFHSGGISKFSNAPLKCLECNETLNSAVPSEKSEIQYYFRFRNIKVSNEFIQLVFIHIPTLFLGGISLFFFLLWGSDVVSYAFADGIKKVFIDFSKRVFGVEWVGIGIIILVFYFLLQIIIYIHNFKKQEKYQQDLLKSRWIQEDN